MNTSFARRIWLALISATVFLQLGVSTVSAATDEVRLYVSPSSQSVVSGANVSVQIRLAKASTAKVDYAKADMTFLSSKLEITSVSRSGSYFTNNNGPVTNFNNTNGTFVISGSGNALPDTADVLLATVTFRAKSAGSSNISFTSSSQAGDLLGGGNVKSALTAKVGAAINVSSPPAPTPTPTTPTSSQQQAPSQTTSTDPPSSPTSGQPADESIDTSLQQQQTTIGTDQSTAETSAQDQTEAVDTTTTGLALWQWVSLGIVATGVLGAVGYVLVMKRRKNSDIPAAESNMPEDIQPQYLQSDDIDVTDDQMSANDASVSSAQDVDIESQSIESDETEPVNLQQPEVGVFVESAIDAPGVVQGSSGFDASFVDTPQPSVTTGNTYSVPPATDVGRVTQVAGIPIEPLDPAMPSPLSTVSSQPVSPEPVSVQSQVAPHPVAPEVSGLEQPDEFPDMFEEGEARLRAEGFDDNLQQPKSR